MALPLTLTNISDYLGPLGMIVVGLFLGFTAILWALLPFALFGIKPRLNRLIAEAAVANQRLANIEIEVKLRDGRGNAPVTGTGEGR